MSVGNRHIFSSRSVTSTSRRGFCESQGPLPSSPGVTQCHCSYFEWYYTRAIHRCLITSVFSRIS